MELINGLAPSAERHAFSVRAIDALRGAVLLMLLSNLGRIPLLWTGDHFAPLLVNDIALTLALMIGTGAIVRTRKLRLDGVAFAALAFACIGGGSAIAAVPRFGISTAALVVSLAYLVRWVFYFWTYVVVINCGRDGDAWALWRSMEQMLLVFSGFGILQAAFLPGFAQLVSPHGGWDIQGNRLVSTVLDPNIAGAMILIGLLVELALIAAGERVARWKPGVLLLATVLTLSRSAVLGLVVGGMVILLARGLSRRLLRLVAVVTVLMAASLPVLVQFANAYGKFDPNGSAAVRLISWAAAFQALIHHPIIGVGFNTWGYVQSQYGMQLASAASYSLDGGLLFIAVLTGAVGLAVYVGMLYLVARRCRAIWRSPVATPAQRGFAIGCVAATVGVCVDSIFLNSILVTFVMELLWIVWGITFLHLRELRHREAGASSAPDAPRLMAALVVPFAPAA
jgi:O-antigen ligase